MAQHQIATETLTTIPVMYRDASNYKSFSKIELIGAFNEKTKSAIQDLLEDGEDFIPTEMDMTHVGQVELEDFGGEDDHVFNTLLLDESVTETIDAEDITEDMITVDEFMKRLKDAAVNGWDPVDAMDELGL